MKTIFTLMILFSGLTMDSQTISSKLTTGDANYSGIYEGVVKKNRSSGPYGLGGKKKLTRIHIFRTEYTNPYYREMYNRSTKETLKPKMIIGLIEYFDNKKGKGTPQQLYFTSVSYAGEDGMSMGTGGANAVVSRDDLFGNKNTDFLRHFTIPNASRSTEFEISTGYNRKNMYRFIKEYKSCPSVLEPYLAHAIEDILKKNRRKSLILGKRGYKSNDVVYSKNLENMDDTMDVVYSYGRSSRDKLENYPDGLLRQLRAEIDASLRNEARGIHHVLHYFPNLTTLKVTLSGSWSKMRPHFFNVYIDRSADRLNFTIENTAEANQFEKKTRLVEIDRERDRKIARQEQERIARREAEQEKKRKEEEYQNFVKVMSETTTSGEPTEKQMKYAIKLKLNVRDAKAKFWSNVDMAENENVAGLLMKSFALINADIYAEINEFKKIKCEPTNDSSSFLCEYDADLHIRSRSGQRQLLYDMLSNGLAVDSETSKAAFRNINGLWVMD